MSVVSEATQPAGGKTAIGHETRLDNKLALLVGRIYSPCRRAGRPGRVSPSSQHNINTGLLLRRTKYADGGC